jgi:hypothetical protein
MRAQAVGQAWFGLLEAGFARRNDGRPRAIRGARPHHPPALKRGLMKRALDATPMQQSHRRAHVATVAVALLSLMVLSVATPGASTVQTFPGGCREIDTMDAKAWGEAVALIVRIDGEDQPITPVSDISLRQEGPGMAHEEEELIPIQVGNVLKAKLLVSRIDLRVDEDPLRAQSWAQASVVELDILNGTVTADVVKAWANAEADTHHAFTRTVDSEIVGLQVADLVNVQSAPGAQIELGPTLGDVVGGGSFVRTYVREDNSTMPKPNDPFYRGDTTVTMLHVYLSDVLGIGSVEVIVSRAHAHAEVPTPFCGLIQSVKAAAYVARARTVIDDSKPGILVGEQHIGVVGGRGHHQLLGTEIPVGEESLAEVNVTESSVFGAVSADSHSESFAMSKILGVCILQDGTVEEGNTEDYGDCLIGITAIRAESNSFANATAAFSWGSVTIVGMTVLGIDVCEALGMEDENHKNAGNRTSSLNICKPPQDTMIQIGPYKIWLNQRERDPPEEGHTGYYVRAVRIQGPVIGDLIISRAYTSADFIDGASGSDTTMTGRLP